MARIRTIKPSFWTDQRVIDLTRDARLLALGMISHADDEGRIVASAAALIGAIYPHDDDVSVRKVERWRAELVEVGLITIYNHGRGTYAAFPGWRKHQYIQKPTPSTLPAPETAGHTPRTGRDAGPRPDSRSPFGSGSRSRTESGSRSGRRSDAEVEVDRDKEVEVDVPQTGPERVRPRAASA